jgi:hypothetical protein
LELEEGRGDEDLEGLELGLAFIDDAVMTNAIQLTNRIIIRLREGVVDSHDYAMPRRVTQPIDLEHVRRDAQIPGDCLGSVQFARAFTRTPIYKHGLHGDFVVHRKNREVADVTEINSSAFI